MGRLHSTVHASSPFSLTPLLQRTGRDCRVMGNICCIGTGAPKVD